MPPSVSLSEASYLAKIHVGIIKGWGNLPSDIQSIVEWAGAAFVEDSNNSRVSIDTKIAKEIWACSNMVTLKSTSSFSIWLSPNEASEDQVAEKFRKNILDQVERMNTDLVKEAQSVANLLK